MVVHRIFQFKFNNKLLIGTEIGKLQPPSISTLERSSDLDINVDLSFYLLTDIMQNT